LHRVPRPEGLRESRVKSAEDLIRPHHPQSFSDTVGCVTRGSALVGALLQLLDGENSRNNGLLN